MKLFTFRRGGIHPHDHKLTAASPLLSLPPPDTAWIPLIQHIGSPAIPVVKVGDKVKVGSLIATAQGTISAPVHSSVSGTVTKIDTVMDAGGFRRPAIIIEREGDVWEDEVITDKTLVRDNSLAPDIVMNRISDGGLVGKGGATFPTRVKYMVPPGKWVDTLIINGVECEPWLTSDHLLMLERADEVIMGADLLRHTLGVKLGIIAIEANKPDAIALLTKRVRELGLEAPAEYLQQHLKGRGTKAADNHDRSGWLTVVACKVKYPQGAEKQLIAAVLGRQVPSGKLPLDIGVIVNNVATAHSAYKIVHKKKPMVERIVTVSGEGVAKPGNYKIRIGTLLSEVLEAAGATVGDGCKVLLGGPMMGKAVTNLAVPVTKGTSGILVLQAEHAIRPQVSPCIRCSKCVMACPMGLEPYLLEQMVEVGQFEEAEARRIRDCVECGSCSWTCPAGRPLVDSIRLGKAQLARKQRKK